MPPKKRLAPGEESENFNPLDTQLPQSKAQKGPGGVRLKTAAKAAPSTKTKSHKLPPKESKKQNNLISEVIDLDQIEHEKPYREQLHRKPEVRIKKVPPPTGKFPLFTDGDVIIHLECKGWLSTYQLHSSTLVHASAWFGETVDLDMSMLEADPVRGAKMQKRYKIKARYELKVNPDLKVYLLKRGSFTYFNEQVPSRLGSSKAGPQKSLGQALQAKMPASDAAVKKSISQSAALEVIDEDKHTHQPVIKDGVSEISRSAGEPSEAKKIAESVDKPEQPTIPKSVTDMARLSISESPVNVGSCDASSSFEGKPIEKEEVTTNSALDIDTAMVDNCGESTNVHALASDTVESASVKSDNDTTMTDIPEDTVPEGNDTHMSLPIIGKPMEACGSGMDSALKEVATSTTLSPTARSQIAASLTTDTPALASEDAVTTEPPALGPMSAEPENTDVHVPAPASAMDGNAVAEKEKLSEKEHVDTEKSSALPAATAKEQLPQSSTPAGPVQPTSQSQGTAEAESPKSTAIAIKGRIVKSPRGVTKFAMATNHFVARPLAIRSGHDFAFAHHNLFLAYYNLPLTISTVDIDFALDHAELLIDVARLYGSIPMVRSHITSALMNFGRDLYLAIMHDPPRWMQLAYYLESAPIFREGLIHAVGSYGWWPWSSFHPPEMFAQTIEVMNRKLSELEALRSAAADSLDAAQLQVGDVDLTADSLTAATADIWSVGQQWKSWFNGALAEADSKAPQSNPNLEHTRRLDHAGVYRLILKGGDAYLPLEEVLDRIEAIKPDGAKVPSKGREVERTLKTMKDYAQEQVAALCVNNSMLPVEEVGIDYFTCINLKDSEMPWVKPRGATVPKRKVQS
ncbi:hypothetical protein MBM_01225 [Drepanopeziza brunnea f. sp. 'multigermtubi' MB_m1]|uniref:Uncharacterized protein n=1 Tax=Marssonina brunnea f. sp. multigermtubi (strain MB_m1) TaxID=1072389 RepID=K1XIJ1_MARBU|nr:uncharacterized protein MBM_01225 [Drepanopeziza brunnea f. sp. 'multigermtubi' MB_m1]EKD20543.1 hypothetical protein MBM_01225 [Drepanopeziza brunnea f. sp. 'multigermtubi' MB_m1]